MADKNISIKGGGLLATMLTVLFIAFKLCGIITWSWWWVLSPLWIDLALTFIIIIIALICVAIFN